MTNELVWDNEEKTVVRQIYVGEVTVDDVKEMAQKTYDLLLTMPHTVHLIVETRNPSRSSRNSFIQAGRTLDKTVAPNQGLVVIIDTSIATQFSIKAIGLTAPKAAKNVYTVATLDEAREVIKQVSTAK
jgi:hypothetical protein